MKLLTRLFLILLMVIALGLNAQTPFGVSYQAVLRNSNGQALAGQSATVRISLTDFNGSNTHYSETHAVTSNALGLINFIIGSGDNASGTYANVPWKDGNIYLFVELKLDGATSFTPFERQKLQAVPYALFAADGLNLQWQGTLSSAPASPQKNYAYYNSVDKKSYIYDGNSWEILTQDGLDGQTGAPGNPGTDGISINWAGSLAAAPATALNKAYYNTTDKKSYIWDGDSWEILAQDGSNGSQGNPGADGISISWAGSLATAPAVALNKAYYNTTDKKSYIWDGNSWETLAQDGMDGAPGSQGNPGVDGISISWAGSLATAPATALNKAYYNTTDKTSYIWDGNSWETLAQDGAQGNPGVDGISITWAGSLATAPATALNIAYYNTTDKTSYIWDGDSWEILAQDGEQGPVGPLVSGSKGQTLMNNGTTWVANGMVEVTDSSVNIHPVAGHDYLDPIFAVYNSLGQVVFAVYEDGVRSYVGSSGKKGAKGGFAVGGLTNQTKAPVDYLFITPDSARIYIDNSITKGTKGGFAVGGLTNQTKGKVEYFRITRDSTRIYIDDTPTKGAKGGFAVGGLTNQSKASGSNFFSVTKDSSYFTNTIISEGNMLVAGTVSTNVGIVETPLTDTDGNIYKTLKIGEQVWMAENLKSTKFADGSTIVDTVFAYNLSTNIDTINTFGRLYSYTAIQSAVSVCPTGWHVPTAIDWQTLFAFVGGQYYETNTSAIGVKLSEAGFEGSGGYWTNQGGSFYPDNSTGFTARPGGSADKSVSWFSFGMGTSASFWVNDMVTPQVVRIDGYSGSTNVQEGSTISAYSVRCIKN